MSLNWTKYGCNVDNKGDLIWMQYQFQRGLNTFAISNPKRNLVHLGSYMLAMSKIVLESRDYDIFDDCKHIWSLLKQIASINGPFRI